MISGYFEFWDRARMNSISELIISEKPDCEGIFLTGRAKDDQAA